jgi:hypothetical protein
MNTRRFFTCTPIWSTAGTRSSVEAPKPRVSFSGAGGTTKSSGPSGRNPSNRTASPGRTTGTTIPGKAALKNVGFISTMCPLPSTTSDSRNRGPKPGGATPTPTGVGASPHLRIKNLGSSMLGSLPPTASSLDKKYPFPSGLSGNTISMPSQGRLPPNAPAKERGTVTKLADGSWMAHGHPAATLVHRRQSACAENYRRRCSHRCVVPVVRVACTHRQTRASPRRRDTESRPNSSGLPGHPTDLPTPPRAALPHA